MKFIASSFLSPTAPAGALPLAADESLRCLHLVFVAPAAALAATEHRLQLFAAARHTAPEYAAEIGLRAIEPLLPYLSHGLFAPGVGVAPRPARAA